MHFTRVLSFMLLPMGVVAQTNSFSLQGKVGSFEAPVKMYLTYRQVNRTVIDSSLITNGVFQFTGTVEEPVQGTLTMNFLGNGPGGKKTQKRVVYVEAGSIKVQGNDSLATAAINGTALNDDYRALTAALKSSTDKMDAFMANYFALPEDQQKDSAVRAKLDVKYNLITAEQNLAYETFIKSHPNTLVSLDALKKYGGSTPEYEKVAPLFDGFSASLKNTRPAKEYAGILAKLKATSVGAMAPDFALNNPDGKPISLASFKGKYLLVDFWASWCGPCRQENPNVVNAYTKFQPKGFEILGVSLDDEKAREKWLAAIEKDKLTWSQVSDLKGWKSDAAELYAIRAIPQNFLLDPSGKIIAKNLRGEALQKKLEEILAP